MCHHTRYKFAQCQNAYNNFATNEKPICIRPCAKAINENGFIDHSVFRKCENFTFEIVKIRSGCTWRPSPNQGSDHRCSPCCKLGELTPHDPRFEFLIAQPNGYYAGPSYTSNLPSLEDMVWYVPEVGCNESIFRPFSWTGGRKRKLASSTDNESIDETYLPGAEPLSPRSLPAPAQPAAVSTLSSPRSAIADEASWLTKHLRFRKHISTILPAPQPSADERECAPSSPTPSIPPSNAPCPTAPLPVQQRPSLAGISRPLERTRGAPNGAHSQAVSATRVALEEAGNAGAAAFRPGFRYTIERAMGTAVGGGTGTGVAP